MLLESGDTCSRHSIEDPVVNEDVFYYPSTRPPRNHISLRQREFVCNLCFHSSVFRSYTAMLEEHLRDKCVSLKSAIKF
jgi:hypothetical protein